MRHLSRWKQLDVELHEIKAQAAAAAVAHALMPNSLAAKLDSVQVAMIELERLMARLQALQPVSSGAAFVIFDTEAGRRACLRAHTLNWWRYLLDLFGCAMAPRFENSIRLRVVPAPEPTDVYWENLEVGPNQIAKRSAHTFVTAALLIGFSGAMLVAFTIEKDREIARLTAEADSTGALAFAQGIAIIAAAVVTGVNSLLRIAVQLLTAFERRDTRTAFEESLFFKLGMAYIINQSLLILLISPNVDTWFVPGGVYSQVRACRATNRHVRLQGCQATLLWSPLSAHPVHLRTFPACRNASSGVPVLPLWFAFWWSSPLCALSLSLRFRALAATPQSLCRRFILCWRMQSCLS